MDRSLNNKKDKMKYLDSDAILTFLLKIASMLILVLAPIHSVLIAVGVLIVLDMITGLLAARKRGEKITSANLKKTVTKAFLYQSSVVVAFLMEQLLLDGIPVVKVVAGIIALTEGKSFFENVHAITGTNFWDEALAKIQAATAKKIPEIDEEEVKSRIETLPKIKSKKRKTRKKRK